MKPKETTGFGARGKTEAVSQCEFPVLSTLENSEFGNSSEMIALSRGYPLLLALWSESSAASCWVRRFLP